MSLAKTNPWILFRTLLILGRVSNLPTVWSNCLAGWSLGGGGGSVLHFGLLCLGATCLYIGGMYWNDAFDAEFDLQHRKERPIPSGAIPGEWVWIGGFAWLAGGILCLMPIGKSSAVLAVLLCGTIILYDAIHKLITFSPVLMASCRFLLYLLAASAGQDGVTGLSIWSALVLGAYIIGLSYLARKESIRGPLRYWPCYLLAAPIALALIVNDAAFRWRGVLLSVLLGVWVVRCLRYTFGGPDRNIGLTVSGLLAGIVFVDLLAVADVPLLLGCVFLIFFAAALSAQRFIPAT